MEQTLQVSPSRKFGAFQGCLALLKHQEGVPHPFEPCLEVVLGGCP